MRDTLLAVVLGAFLVILGYSAWRAYRAERELASAKAQMELIVGDAQIRIAELQRKKGELEALLRHAEELDGELIGGVEITVPADTLERQVGETPTEYPDSVPETRVAELTDSLDTGHQIHITAVAGPYPDPIHIGYKLILPEFKPQVGFVRRSDSYFAVVHWANRSFEISEAFFVAPSTTAFALYAGSEMYAHTSNFREVYGRVYLALQYSTERWNVQLQGGLSPHRSDLPTYVGIRLERKLF